jgi:DNA polymerase-3 subunit delta'
MHPWNEPILASLAARAASGRLPHAMLIHGMQGVGKLALAERVAQLLLCETESGAKPCGSCDGCRWFLGGNHPDFLRLEPEALSKAPEPEEGEAAPSKKTTKPSLEIKIEQVRGIASFLNLRSSRGRLRVALVHPAEDMNLSAANALLKGLEEPPAGAMFLLVSHRPAQLPPTIRSRCVAVPVPVPPRKVALDWLSGQGIKGAERWLAYAGGAPLRALHYAAQGETLESLLKNPGLVDSREGAEELAEVLQKIALDRSFTAFGLPSKYQTAAAGKAVSPATAKAWLAYARQMGKDRLLASHPLNPKLYSADLLARLPKT